VLALNLSNNVMKGRKIAPQNCATTVQQDFERILDGV
jgi:hypothetical protein